MKAMGILALLLGLGATGSSVFAKVETWDNFKAMFERAKTGDIHLSEMALIQDYASTLDTLHMVSWGTGALALILGIVAMAKTKKTNLVPGIGALLGVAGAALTFLTMP